MFAPVPVITNTLATPTALMLTLPLLLGIFTLLLPFACGPIKFPVVKLPTTVTAPTESIVTLFAKVEVFPVLKTIVLAL